MRPRASDGAAVPGFDLHDTVVDVSVLVTGGAGYIGRHTVRALRWAGREVVVLDTLERSNRESLFDTPLVVGDIADSALVRSVCAEHGVEEVIHFAAYKLRSGCCRLHRKLVDCRGKIRTRRGVRQQFAVIHLDGEEAQLAAPRASHEFGQQGSHRVRFSDRTLQI